MAVCDVCGGLKEVWMDVESGTSWLIECPACEGTGESKPEDVNSGEK